MKVITDIVPVGVKPSAETKPPARRRTKSRCRIYLDDEFAFVLYKGELDLYGISPGAAMPAETYQEIHDQVLVKRARLRAFYLLGKRRYTESQLREKLKQGEYPAGIIDITLDGLKSAGYIDDILYARDYIECHLQKKSRNRIRHDLKGKGISFEITDVIYAELTQDNLREKQRVFALLIRKGFPIETIRQFL